MKLMSPGPWRGRERWNAGGPLRRSAALVSAEEGSAPRRHRGTLPTRTAGGRGARLWMRAAESFATRR